MAPTISPKAASIFSAMNGSVAVSGVAAGDSFAVGTGIASLGAASEGLAAAGAVSEGTSALGAEGAGEVSANAVE